MRGGSVILIFVFGLFCNKLITARSSIHKNSNENQFIRGTDIPYPFLEKDYPSGYLKKQIKADFSRSEDVPDSEDPFVLISVHAERNLNVPSYYEDTQAFKRFFKSPPRTYEDEHSSLESDSSSVEEESTEIPSYESPYMMGIPAQFQNFPIFNPNYYQSQEASTDKEKPEETNLIESTPHGGRFRRSVLRTLRLRSEPEYNNAGIRSISNPTSGNLIQNDKGADCTGRRPGPGGNNGGGGNGIDPRGTNPGNTGGDAAGTDGGDAVDQEAEALRLRGRRTNNSRRTANRNG